MRERKGKKQIQKRPNPVLYFILGGLAVLAGRIMWRFRFKGTKPRGPAIVISNHTSNIDWLVEIGVSWPRPMTFLATYHFFTFRFLGFLLDKVARAIPKYQFATDLSSIRRMKSVLHDSKGLIFIAPEGTVWGSGHLGYIPPSICKLIRMMDVPVYASRIRGAGLGCAKWSKHLHRAHVTAETRLLFTEQDTRTLSPDEMYERIVRALDYNEFDFQAQNNITSTARSLARGFETMFYLCPHCGSEFTLAAHGNTVTCSSCNTQALMGPDFRFTWNTPTQYFDNYSQWYDWQFEKMKQFISQKDFVLEEEVDYGIDVPGVNNYKKVGHGIIRLSPSGWDYTGTFEGRQVSEHDDLRQVPLATLKTGLHFELPFRFGHCRVFYPSNGLHAMKWHLASRAVYETLL